VAQVNIQGVKMNDFVNGFMFAIVLATIIYSIYVEIKVYKSNHK
jgi:hypothetical protein